MGVDGVVLAAGLSSRMGRYKMSLKIGNKTLIESCIESMYDFCSNIIVVVGYNHNLIVKILEPYRKVKIVLNPNYMDGMFSSIKIAVKEVINERFFLIPSDYPLIKKDTYTKMLKIKSDIVVPSYCGKKGHPILLNSNITSEITNNHNYESLRDFINNRSFRIIEVQDEGILMDIDTIEDYEKASLYRIK